MTPSLKIVTDNAEALVSAEILEREFKYRPDWYRRQANAELFPSPRVTLKQGRSFKRLWWWPDVELWVAGLKTDWNPERVRTQGSLYTYAQ